MIEHAGLEVTDQHEDLEIGNGKLACGEVPAAMCFEPLLQPREIEWERALHQRLALRLLLLVAEKHGRRDLACDVLDRIHRMVSQRSLPMVWRMDVRECEDIAIQSVWLR